MDWLLALTVAGMACSGEGTEGEFPEGFLFGAATAGFQVDMGCPDLSDAECTDPNSDWYQYVTSPETVALTHTHLTGEDPAEVGPGHWQLYERDFDLASQDGHSVFRMSIEWSRVFPTSTAGIEGHDALRAAADPDALAHYHAIFAALRERGIEPYVTLHHYTMPTWIHDGVGCTLDFAACTERGWVDRESTVREIAKYAGFVAEEFGTEVDLWATQNEPFAVLLPGYLQPTESRTNPPALTLRSDLARTVLVSMVEAHARMYDAIHAADTTDASGDGTAADVGIVYAMAPVKPIDPEDALDQQAAENVFYLWNMVFLNAVAGGVLDENMDGEGQLRSDLANRMDHVGINYKVRIAVEGTSTSILPDLSPLATFNPLRLEQDEVYPRGIYEMSLLVHERFDLPVYITENNGQSVKRGEIEAEKRLVVENLQWLARAIRDGVDVRGYIYWSLIDNYEWNHGTSVPLGLYAVDPSDPDRTRVPRDTRDMYARIAEAGAVPSDLVDRYPIGDAP